MPAVVVPVAASTLLADLLDAPACPGRVVLVGRSAAYVRVDDRLVAVVGEAAPAPPHAVVLPADSRYLLSGRLSGLLSGHWSDDAPVLIGRGRLRLRDVELRPVRWWLPARVRRGRLRLRVVSQLADMVRDDDRRLPPGVQAAVESGARSIVAGQVGAASAELGSVLGLGRGLTPAADDAVAGVLLASRAFLPRCAFHATSMVAAASDRTNAVSAAMIHDAAAGWASRQVVDAVGVLTEADRDDGLDDDGLDDDRAVLASLLRIGHSSGVDLARGLLAVADALQHRGTGVLADSFGQPARECA